MKDINRLKAFEMWMWRSMDRFASTQLRTNKRKLQVVEENIDNKNNPRAIEKLVGPHSESGLPSRNYNRGQNERGKDRKKTDYDVTGLDDDEELQQGIGVESGGSLGTRPQ